MWKWCLHLFSVVFYPFLFILADNEDMHKISDEFEFRQDRTTDYGVRCLWGLKNSHRLIMGKWFLHASSFIFDRIIIKVAGNQDRHKSSDKFDFGPVVSMAHLYGFWNEIWPWHIGLRWAIVALWATCFFGNIGHWPNLQTYTKNNYTIEWHILYTFTFDKFCLRNFIALKMYREMLFMIPLFFDVHSWINLLIDGYVYQINEMHLDLNSVSSQCSLLWWELGTNSLITGPGEWLSFRRFTSKLSWVCT